MANPVNVTLTNGQWTKVATAVTSGNLYIKSRYEKQYNHTYRLTGETAPTDLTDAVPFDESGYELVDSSEEIDVYIHCSSSDGIDGSVRVAV